MSFAQTSVTEAWTVRDVMRCFPISTLLFLKLGIDTDCGATATLDVAATTAGISTHELLELLESCTDDNLPRRNGAIEGACS